MVTISFTEKDAKTLFEMAKDGVFTLDDSGSAIYNKNQIQNATQDELLKEIESLRLENETLKNNQPQILSANNDDEINAIITDNEKLRDTLGKLVKEYEALGAKYADLEANFNAQNGDNEAITALEAKVKDLENQLKEKNKGLQDSQDYKDLAESNRLLEITANNLAKENEHLKEELLQMADKKDSTEASDKVKELQGRLDKAVEVFKEQKAKIKELESSGGNIAEIETRIKAEANKKLAEKWTQYTAQKDKEAEAKIKEISALMQVEREQKDSRIKELEAKLSSQEIKTANAQGVPFSLMDFVDKLMPMINNKLNPTQRSDIKRVSMEMARDLTECYAKDYQDDSQSEAEERQKQLEQIGNEIEAVAKGELHPAIMQDDLPF